MLNKIKINNIIYSIIVNGFFYLILLFVFDKFSHPIANILSLPIFTGIFYVIGFYVTFSKKEGLAQSLIIAILLITVLDYYFYKLHLIEICDSSNNNFLNILMHNSIYGFLSWYLKFSILSAIENNPVKKSAADELEVAIQYRMNPYIRYPGIIVGLLLAFGGPALTIRDIFFNPKLDFSNAPLLLVCLFVFLIVVCPAILGGFFLSYCVPGKTPQYVLNFMKRKINN